MILFLDGSIECNDDGLDDLAVVQVCLSPLREKGRSPPRPPFRHRGGSTRRIFSLASRVSLRPSPLLAAIPAISDYLRTVFHREKRGSSRQPFVTVPYLNCFHGFPFRSIHTARLPATALLCCFALRSTNLNYPGGCFDADPGCSCALSSPLPPLPPSPRLAPPGVDSLPSLLRLVLHILRAPVGTLSQDSSGWPELSHSRRPIREIRGSFPPRDVVAILTRMWKLGAEKCRGISGVRTRRVARARKQEEQAAGDTL